MSSSDRSIIIPLEVSSIFSGIGVFQAPAQSFLTQRFILSKDSIWKLIDARSKELALNSFKILFIGILSFSKLRISSWILFDLFALTNLVVFEASPNILSCFWLKFEKSALVKSILNLFFTSWFLISANRKSAKL